MTATKLATKYVEKPWGRTQIPAVFSNVKKRQIGEIWFDGPEGERPPLLIKYIFTSEKLSIQVHPNDAQGQKRGFSGGKEECWYILDAEPGASLGIGLKHALGAEELRAAAIDGSLEDLVDWKPAKPGDFFFIPAGTVHAIGAGLTLVEVQQNVDVTYRLYDYGRPRPLHLDDSVAVSKAASYELPSRNFPLGSNVQILSGHPFALEMRSLEAGATLMLPPHTWFIPLDGLGEINSQLWRGSECWLTRADTRLCVTKQANVLLASV